MAEQDSDALSKVIPGFTGGLNLFAAKTDIADTELTNMSNVVVEDGKLGVDQGFGTYASGSPVSGSRRLFYRFRLKDGTEQRLCFTRTGLFYQLPGAPTTWVSAWDAAQTGDFSCTGDTSDELPITAVTWMAEDMVIWTNGVDTVFKYWLTGGKWTCQALGGLAGAGDDPTVDTCKSLVIWQDRLLLLNTTESSTAKPHLIRWSDEADPEEFDAVSTVVDAGFQFLYEDGGHIQHAVILESFLIIYRDASIVRASWIGSSTKTIDFQTMIPHDGILGARSVVATSDAHYVVMRRGIFKYTGGVSLEPIGPKVDKLLLGPGSSVNLAKPNLMYGHFTFVEKACWFSFPTVAGNTIFLIYDYLRKTWYRRDLSGLCTSLNEVWLTTTNYYHMTTTQTAAILDYDHSTTTDKGAAIAWSFETKNFAAEFFIRTDFVELDLLGTDEITITLAYSTDDGVTWTTFATVTTPATLTAQLIRNKFPKQITGQNVMFKVSGTGGQCKFGRFKLAFFDQSEF